VVATAADTHRQRSAATVVVPPPGACLEATLEAVHQLLHNPPGPHASPSATKQWHHDADKLVVAAINTLTRGGGQVNPLGRSLVASTTHSRSPAVHSRPPMTSRVSSAVHATSLTTTDLRAELERRSLGEDGYITIKH
jgi:hypothetical protein